MHIFPPATLPLIMHTPVHPLYCSSSTIIAQHTHTHTHTTLFSCLFIMATLLEMDAYVMGGGVVGEEQLDIWITTSDIAHATTFFAGDAAAVRAAVGRLSKLFVENYLNNPHLNEVPLRRKTKFCLVLNNFALYSPVRDVVFASLDNLTSIFEAAIKQEGTMPFDSELGRMSEHVLVLLMRVTNYTLSASAVHEFAEHNTQFAIQLLLAIVLKEPPYEFELRCNCINGLLGFTQPQAFFGAGDKIEEHSCSVFTQKIDFTLNLMLRLHAIQVVSDVLSESIFGVDTVPPHVRRAMNSVMKTIMNIFKFSSENSTQWRQHILLSTTFLDGTVMFYIQTLVSELQAALEQPHVRISGELLQSLSLAFKFASFASYRLGEAASELRLYCSFFHDLTHQSIRPIVSDAKLSGQFMVMYINMFHLMANVDALGDESVLPPDELLDELRSDALRQSLETFLRAEVAGCGLPFTQAWQQQFKRIGTMDAVETPTYAAIEGIFATLVQELSTQQQPAPAVAVTKATSAAAGGARLLGDMPSLKKPSAAAKMSVERAAAPVKTRFAGTRKDNVEGVDKDLLCALTGNVMKNPVSSPYGHTFEQEAILGWLEQNGSVCPITGKPLSASQLVPNEAVRRKVMQQMVQMTMAAQPQGPTDDDLYDF